MAKTDESTTKEVSYECLYDVTNGNLAGLTFYDEGYSSLKKAEKAMKKLRDQNKCNGFVRTNFRIVRHEVIDKETVVRRYPTWDEENDNG